MTTQRDPDSVLAAWLDEGPVYLPEHTRRSILVSTRTAGQRRPMPLAWRTSMPLMVGFALVVAAIAIAGVIGLNLFGANLGPGGAPTPRLPSAPPAASTSPKPAASAAPSSGALVPPSATPLIEPRNLPDAAHMTVVAMVSHRATVPGATFDPRFTWTVHSAPERSTCDLILGMGNGNYMSGMTPPITFRAKDRTTVVYELPPTFPVGAPLPWFVTCKLNGVTWAGGGQWQP